MGFLFGLLLLVILVAIVWTVVIMSEGPTAVPIVPDVPEGETEERSFAWSVRGTTHQFDLRCTIMVRIKQYFEAQGMLLKGIPNKTAMYSDKQCFQVAQAQIMSDEYGYGAQEIRDIKEYLLKEAQDKCLSNYELSHAVLGFAQEQCIQYAYDKDSKNESEYFRFPIESVYDCVGDCDCKAILACACFKALDYDVALALMPDHAALAISLGDNTPFANFSYKGKRWYYCEATGDNWTPGTIPDDINQADISLFELR